MFSVDMSPTFNSPLHRLSQPAALNLQLVASWIRRPVVDVPIVCTKTGPKIAIVQAVNTLYTCLGEQHGDAQ